MEEKFENKKMGSNQSARKLTIPNDAEGEGVIQVSNAIVQRLTQGMQETSDNSKDVRIQQTQPSTPEGGVAPPPSGYPTYYSDHTISALEMQTRKDAEIDRLEEYWNNRLFNLKKSHMQINQIFDCEYKKAIAQYSEGKLCYLSTLLFIHFTEEPSYPLTFRGRGFSLSYFNFFIAKFT